MRRPTVVSALLSRPRAVFCAFVALHISIWAALPTLLFGNLPVDVIEGLVYGREFQVVYWKHPPLPWWIIEIVHRLIGRDVAYYVIAQVAVIGAFAMVWLLGRRLVGELGALAAVLIVDGIYYFTLAGTEFNHNSAQLPLWGVAGYAFHASLRAGRVQDWVLLGVSLGVAVWAKFFVFVLALPLALFLLFDSDARKTLATPGPWIALACVLLVAAPQLIWLTSHYSILIAYIDERSVASAGALDHLLRPTSFMLSQIGVLVPAMLIAMPLAWPSPQPLVRIQPDTFDRRIVSVLTLGPALSLLAFSVLTGRSLQSSWGWEIWLFLGLWFVLHARRGIDNLLMERITIRWAIVFVAFVVIFAADFGVLANFDHRRRRELFPGDQLAEEVARRFQAATGRKLVYVIGDSWTGGNAVVYGRDRPQLMVDGDPTYTPWIDISDLRAKGAAIVWLGDPNILPPYYARIAGQAEVGMPIKIPYRRGAAMMEVGLAVLRPSGK